MYDSMRHSQTNCDVGGTARFIADADLAEIQLVLHCFNGCITI